MEQCSTTQICGPKRKEDDELDPIKITRSSNFWFEDGNIVLQAEHTQFRIHRSFLSMHSPIFRDMFACSKPENGPTIDGCPLIHLPETSECLNNFVKLLYDSMKTYNRSGLVSLSVLKTMLHFGRKYGIRKLRQEAVYCLTLEFPSTLQRWSCHTFGNVIDGADDNPSTLLFEILYLAYEYSIPLIVPVLYLRICLCYDAKEIAEAFQSIEKKSPLINKLLINCLLGREDLHRSVSSLTLASLHGDKSSPDGCKTTQQCREKRSTLTTQIWNNNVQFSLQFGMDSWKPWQVTYGEGLCSTCLESARVAHRKARVTNWKQLKTYFRLCDLEDKPESDSDDPASAGRD
ncbi:hypothetical protein BYT27DRAFT_7244823 [Phlegmacium glaucopus]|nr:hypothetical protein BYT27DRAFT_7244823 [Phlegmacium glaucopus]